MNVNLEGLHISPITDLLCAPTTQGEVTGRMALSLQKEAVSAGQSGINYGGNHNRYMKPEASKVSMLRDACFHTEANVASSKKLGRGLGTCKKESTEMIWL